ncbi:Ammonium transporter domain containing protein [Aphelenchoides bicaudatus]|nr:Ammonium transporter domain containing protein [Aphelenchoides bicaudatus]
MAASKFASHQFTLLVTLLSIVFLVLFCLFGRYSGEALPAGSAINDFANVSRNYPLLHDSHALVLIGFGFLVTFLRRYGFSAIAINLLLVAFVLEVALLVRGFLSEGFSNNGVFTIALRDVAKADYTAAAVLVSYGAVVGKLTPIQYVILALIEAPVSILNEHLVLNILGAGDVGGAIVVHFFGAIFGIVVARIVFQPQHKHSEHQGSIYHSDIFSFIGTVFLWAFWPSFNSIFATRAVLNTFLALIGSTLTTFLFSQLVHKERRFNVKHIASASLAGGVASGAVATLFVTPFPALLLGIPTLAAKLNIHDTRGVFSLHAIPAIVGVFGSVFFLFLGNTEQFGVSIRNIYPRHKYNTDDGRVQAEQALYQLAGLGATFAVALVSGAITGLIIRLKIFRQVREKEAYADADFFDVPEDYDFTTRVTSHIERVELTEHTERTKLTNNEA